MNKKIGFVGLGKMGNAMVEQMIEKDIEVVVYNRTKEKVEGISKIGAIPSYSLEELVSKSRNSDTNKCVIWLMVKAGEPVDDLIFGNGNINDCLIKYLHKGDVLIDGGNSYYIDSIRRYKKLSLSDIHFIDCGTSGGIKGARNGACLMVGGDKEVFNSFEWLFKEISTENGYAYLGNSGSGHYTKMVHNAIEYGMMQSIAEGLDLLENGAEESLGNKLNLANVLRVWNHGSIVESYLTKITENALSKDPHLDTIKDFVDDNGEGAYTIIEALKTKIPFLTVVHALFMRYTTRKNESFAMKVIAAQRNEFGGHDVKKT